MELHRFFWTLFGIAYGLEMQPETPPIRIKQGLLQGSRERRCEVVTYLGVPFAEPPVETLRFRPPVMHRGWRGVYQAVKRKLPCWQPEKMKALMRVQNFSEEDCLYMNIHAPIRGPRDQKLRPVLFNIHGGAFNCLWAVTGEKLAAAADAVFVAPQYRLGVLGFLATESAPSNLGLQDQVLALQWVQENIHNFGGDPKQLVMIFGGSGGGAAVAAHLTMPSSWGLFQAAGMDSPGGHQGWHAAEDPRVRQDDDFMLTSLSLKDSLDYAQSLGCEDAGDLQCLQGFDAKFLIQHATTSSISRQKRWFFSAAMPVEGDFPLALIARGAWHRVPMIVGISSCEACKLATLQSGPVGTNLTREEFREDMSRWGFSGRGSSEISPDDLELWYASRIEREGYWRTVARIIADSAWACQGVLHAEAAVLSGGLNSGVYMYYLNYTPPGYPYPGGLHGYIAQWYMQRPYRPSAGERTLMSSLAHYWANLARNGSPNSGDLQHWPVFDPEEQNNVMILDVPMFAGTSLDVQRSECQHWKPYFGWAEVNVTSGS